MADQSGSETILVVDDETIALEFCRNALERAGYHVFAASSGEQALTYFQPNRSPVDLALIDVFMPGMTGVELAKRIKKLDAGTQIILMSGYSPEEVQNVVGSEAAEYRSMWKPFQAGALVQMIRNVLETYVEVKKVSRAKR